MLFFQLKSQRENLFLEVGKVKGKVTLFLLVLMKPVM